MPKITEFNRFRHYSQQAAKQEREQRWADAAISWDSAYFNAKGVNQNWCDSRRQFCKRMARKAG